jgi:beta-glucosidase
VERVDLSAADIALLERMRAHSRALIVILISGRPLVVTGQWDLMDALIAAWLPGTEGQGAADVLFGDVPFTGKLPFSWPRAGDQLPFDFAELPKGGCDAPLFPYGFGLSADDPPPSLPDCSESR